VAGHSVRDVRAGRIVADHNPHNAYPDDQSVVEQILTWLEAHGIERRLVPADPCASVADGQLTIQLWASGPSGSGIRVDPMRPNEVIRETVTVPVAVPPPPVVETWLAPKCPMCGR